MVEETKGSEQEHPSVALAKTVRKMFEKFTAPIKEGLRKYALAALTLIPTGATMANSTTSSENPMPTTETPSMAEAPSNNANNPTASVKYDSGAEITKLFDKNPEQIKEMYVEYCCKNMTSNFIDQMETGIKGKKIKGLPYKAYCLAGLMRDVKNMLSEDMGQSDLYDKLPKNKAACGSFIEAPAVQAHRTPCANNAEAVRECINNQEGDVFLAFLPRSGGSGYHATCIVKKDDELKLCAYNGEHFMINPEGLIDYMKKTQKKIGNREIEVINLSGFYKETLHQELEKCTTGEEFVKMCASTGGGAYGATALNAAFDYEKPIISVAETLAKDAEKSAKILDERVAENLRKQMSETKVSVTPLEFSQNGNKKKAKTVDITSMKKSSRENG